MSHGPCNHWDGLKDLLLPGRSSLGKSTSTTDGRPLGTGAPLLPRLARQYIWPGAASRDVFLFIFTSPLLHLLCLRLLLFCSCFMLMLFSISLFRYVVLSVFVSISCWLFLSFFHKLWYVPSFLHVFCLTFALQREDVNQPTMTFQNFYEVPPADSALLAHRTFLSKEYIGKCQLLRTPTDYTYPQSRRIHASKLLKG